MLKILLCSVFSLCPENHKERDRILLIMIQSELKQFLTSPGRSAREVTEVANFVDGKILLH